MGEIVVDITTMRPSMASIPEEEGDGSNSQTSEEHANDPKAKQAHEIYDRLSYIRSASLLVLALLPIFNEPEWCNNNISGGHCDKSGKYLLSGVNYLPKSIFFLLEFMCMLPLAVSLILQRIKEKPSTFWGEWSTLIKVGLLVAMGLQLVTSVSQMSFLRESRQVGMYLCVLIPVVFSRSIRGCFRMTLGIGHSYLDTAGILVAFMLISAWLASELFHQPNFRDFRTSLLSLFIMLTTANNPDVWAETYEQNRSSVFFFFTYMAVAYFFLMHLLFALIYNSYKIQLANSVQNHTATRAKNVHKTFELLDLHQAGISIQTAKALFIEVSRYWHVYDLDIGSIVDEITPGRLSQGEGEGENISFVEFKVLCSTFVLAVEDKLQHSEQRFNHSENILESVGYLWLSFGATLASLVVAIFDQTIRDSEVPDIQLWHARPSKFSLCLEVLTKCEFVFGWLFLANLAFRIWVQGTREYIRNILNCFDCVTTLVIIGLQISTIWYPNAYNWISISIMIRSMRYITLLGYFSRWRFMGHLIFSMVPATAPLLGFQLCVCALSSVAGVHIFGGQVFVGNPLLNGTDYAKVGLWVYNYNDFGSAMVTSFNLCIVNNWYVIMDGYVAATGTSWARAYFVIFWAIGVTLTLNVVVAVIVGALVGQLDRADHAKFLYELAPPSSKRSLMHPTLSTGLCRSISTDLYEGITDNVP